MGVVVQAVKHSVMRSLSVFCVFLVVGLFGWFIYSYIIRPVLKPQATTATSQKAGSITNNYINPSTQEVINAVNNTKESALELNLFPPKIKIGGFKISIFK